MIKLISVNVGLPRLVEYNGEPISTAIYKTPVAGRVAVGKTNLAGDRQADLRVHGGWSKAVYAYPREHYDFWRAELPDVDLPFGVWGENLMIEGLLENEVCAGDRLRIGTAEFVVTEPRQPCFKLGIRLGRKDIIKRFEQSGRSGFYLAIRQTGEIAAGDRVEIVERDPNRVSIRDILRLKSGKSNDAETLSRAIKIEALPVNLKTNFRSRLAKLETD